MFGVGAFTLCLCSVHFGVAVEPQRSEIRLHRGYVSDARNVKMGECNTQRMEYRLQELESQLKENSGNLIGELREGNRRLQNLENQSEKFRTTIDELRRELTRYLGVNETPRLTRKSTDAEALGLQMDTLAKEVQLIIAALRMVHSDIKMVKEELSVIKSTNVLLKGHDISASSSPAWSSNNTNRPPRSCKEILDKGNNPKSGIYLIQPPNFQESFLVQCEMSIDGGGWTYIHNRVDGSQDFNQDFQSYISGFGNLAGEFWLGLEYIYQLTGHSMNELLIELVDQTDAKKYARYDAFSIGSSAQGYHLKVLGKYTGDAGDSLSYHAGAKFSTKDHDVDTWTEGSCALSHKGAWWYKECDRSNLNGLYIKGLPSSEQTYQAMYWNDFGGPTYSLKAARMLIRE